MHQADGQDKTITEKLYLTDDGLQFDNSILWLDSQKNGKLSFLSSALSVKERYNSQVIVSEETHKLLKLYNPDLKALICQYNRPFSIGRYDLELLPSGSALGASSLYIDTGSEKILYAPTLSETKTSLARSLQLKPVDYLILRVDHCDPLKSFFSQRKKELNNLVESVKKCLQSGKTPVVLAPLLHTASELCSVFSEEKLKTFAHKVIYDINKIYEDFGHPVGSCELLNLNKEAPSEGVLIVPPSFRSKKIFLSTENHEFFFVCDKGDTTHLPNSCDTFMIPLPERNLNITKMIKQIEPKKTFLFGPYATRFAALNRSLNTPIEVLQPYHQKPLL